MAARPLASVARVLALFVALSGCASTPAPDPDPIDPAAGIPPVATGPIDPDPQPSVNTGPSMMEGMNFLQKPYDPETLAKMVRDCLNN